MSIYNPKKYFRKLYFVSSHSVFLTHSHLHVTHGGTFKIHSNIYDGGFCENSLRLLAVNYIAKKVRWLFGYVVDTGLIYKNDSLKFTAPLYPRTIFTTIFLDIVNKLYWKTIAFSISSLCFTLITHKNVFSQL